ncbi:serine palmitoyltransferase component [Kappamyces sp. JEL0829]|nr:serine palmitoyltransferase component [Kappamyces sp. JEL0829]
MNEAKELAYTVVNQTFNVVGDVYSAIPGGSIVLKYCRESYQNDPGRSLLELLLVCFMVWYWFNRRYSPGSNEVELTEKEIEQLIEDWEPEPLCRELTDFEKFELEKTTTFTGTVGLKAKGIDGRERANFASLNFLGLMNTDHMKEKAVETLRTYGVGTCDVHLQLEETLANFVGADAAILYSQGFSCISSVIPAFAKRGDVILADECVNFAIQKGLQISRSNVKYFKHNDMEDLERLMKVVDADRKKFIVVEGIYANMGDICPLPELIELKKKYKYRLMVEESMSLGVLGSRGAGVANHFDLAATNIDLIVASLANAFSGSGGFCAGSKEIVEHQRLGGQSYVYSASLPAILAVTAIEGVHHLEKNPDTAIRLSLNSEKMHAMLGKALQGTSLKIDGVPGSPILHIRMFNPSENREDDERFLQEIVDLAAKDSVVLTRAKYVVAQERLCPPPSIRVALSAGFTRREVERTANVIRDALRRAVKSRQRSYF